MNKEREQNYNQTAIDRAIDMLWAWAQNNPEEYDPTNAIDDIASVATIDEPVRNPIRVRLWNEWTLIEGERRLIDDFEDDLG